MSQNGGLFLELIRFLFYWYFIRRKITWNIQKYFNLWHFIQNLTGAKPLRIRVNKTDRFIKIHNRIRYLVLFDFVLFDKLGGLNVL